MAFLIRFLKLSLVLLTAFLCTSAHWQHSSASISRGDTYFALMRYRDAIAWYNLDSSRAEAQWKIARACVCYGDHAPAAEKEEWFRHAVKAAKRCIELDETNSNGHTWLAAAWGNTAMYEGSKTKVQLCNQIKAQLERAVALNPKDDVAHSIFGSFYREVAHISWVEKQLAMAFIGKIPEGTYEQSEQSFHTAIALAPDIMRHWYELGLLYVYWNKPESAKIAFGRAKNCPVKVSSDNDRLLQIDGQLKKLNGDR